MTKHEEEQSIEYEQTISKISQNILNAENAMSYGNENGARELLTEAQSLISELPDKTEAENAKIRELSNDVQAPLAKLQHVIITDAPRDVATFAVEGQTTNVAELQLLGTTLYSFDPALKIIFRAEVGSGAVTVWPQDKKDTTFQYFTVSGSATLLFLNTANGLDEFNVESENLQSLTFELGNVNIIGMAPYESRLYLLDLKGNQILRSYRSGNGFGSPVEWMKDDTNLREAESIAIDGFIYVLTKDGTVYRMFQGARQDWSLATIDPPLDRADKVWTDVKTDNLYILDSQGKRVVEFTKEGSLLNQYTSPKFTNIKDFTVDFGNKKLYVLNANTVYEIDLQ